METNKPTGNKDSDENQYFKLGLIVSKVVVAIWLIYWIAAILLEKDSSTRAEFGDMFGAINALFTGLAFAGLIVTIIMQSKELKFQGEQLKIQGDELRNQNQQLELQAKELKVQSDALISSTNEFIEQNKTLKRQRFETTFFNLLELRNENLRNHDLSRRIVAGLEERIDMPYHSHEKSFWYFYDCCNDIFTEQGSWKFTNTYFSNLLGILQFVENSTLIDEKEQSYYISILFAFLTAIEKRFVFYYIPFCKHSEPMNIRLQDLYKKYKISNFLGEPWMHSTHQGLQNFDINDIPTLANPKF